MRSHKELIDELNTEAKKLKGCSQLSLVVRIEEGFKLITAGSDAIEGLNELVSDGGRPIGFLAVANIGKINAYMRIWPLAELRSDPEACRFLSAIRETCKKICGIGGKLENN